MENRGRVSLGHIELTENGAACACSHKSHDSIRHKIQNGSGSGSFAFQSVYSSENDIDMVVFRQGLSCI